MKKIVFRAPVQTASGYGVHSRMLLKALDEDGRFDIDVISIPWGATPLIYDETPEMQRVKELAMRFDPRVPHNYDASVQVTIPNEFALMAPKNICVTAGIETDRVAPLWQQKCNEVADVVVVPSLHSARSFTTGIYNGDKGPNQLLLRKPLYILPEWVDTDVYNTAPVDPKIVAARSELALDDMPGFNFVVVGLGMDKPDGEDRKNLVLTVKWFCEQFKDNPDVGLVLKVSMVNNSLVDLKNVLNRIRYIKSQAGCGQFPKIKLIHGRLSGPELAALYKSPKVKAFVSLTHGEGFGLPIIEAAACGLPVIATDWSGHLDFLRVGDKNKFVPVEYDLAPVPQSCVWKDVMEAGTMWANPRENDAKLKMAKVVLSYDRPKEWAAELATYIAQTFNRELGRRWADDMFKLVDGQPVQLTKNVLVRKASSQRKLDNVTLVAIDTQTGEGGFRAIEKSLEQIKFGKILLVVAEGSKLPGSPPEDVVVCSIPPFLSVQDHDRWVLKELPKYITTDFFMTVQPDGYVLNGSAWDDRFLEYDLVGAPWFWDNVVGNMGFCLRSTKLARELQSDEYPQTFPMDVNVCRVYRPALEAKGFKWAPPEVASRFSVENLPYEGQFGWHGENPFYGDR